jgi:hypothetical protein
VRETRGVVRRPSLDRSAWVAAGAFLAACAAAYGGLFSHAYPGDVGMYERYGREWVLQGLTPFHVFFVEYPPGAVPLFAIPVVWNDHYVILFKLLMTACGVGFVVCSAWVLRRLDLGAWRLVPVVVAPLLMGPVFLNRYDPLAAFVVSLALVFCLRGNERTSSALVGVGAALKIYPAVLVPLALRRVRTVAGGLGTFLLAVAVLTLPWVAISPGGVGFSLWTQASRHMQIESLGSSLLLAGSKLGIHHVGWLAGEPGSIDTSGRLADTLGGVSTVVAVMSVLLVAWAYWSGPDDDARFVTAWAAAVTGFVVFGKILSPQYLTWLVPLVPLAAGRWGRLAAGLFLAVLALTMPEYLLHRDGLREQDWTVWVLLLRNLGLVGIFGLLFAELRGSAWGVAPVARPAVEPVEQHPAGVLG